MTLSRLSILVLLATVLAACQQSNLPSDDESIKISRTVFGASGKARCRDERLVSVRRSESHVETFWKCQGDLELLEVIVVIDGHGVVEILRTNKGN